MTTKAGIGDQPPPLQEEELTQRSSKKVKGGTHDFNNNVRKAVDYADITGDVEMGDSQRKSYKETVLGIEAGSGSGNTEKDTPAEFPGDEFVVADMRLQIIEKLHGGHECPEIIIPPHAEERLCRPWKQGLLVKLLGRKIGFKALENRLNQMWVEKGTMQIIDLGSDFFLVYLSSQGDYNHALTNGPWLIYDHYLTVREWRPNFRPEKEEINRVAVWVRLSELPVEYYNSDFLDFLGNRIGKTVKVDKTTQQMSRGKYARLCVEIDLDAPLLAMFELKNHIYKIEYEGLHMLCLVCGRFGHHKDQCTERNVTEVPVGDVQGAQPRVHQNGLEAKKTEEGPWTVVQKQRWPRKVKEKGGPVVGGGGRILPASLNGINMKSGSRFNVLGAEEENQGGNNNVRDINGEGINDQIISESEPITENKATKVSDSVKNRIIVEINKPAIKEPAQAPHDSQQERHDPLVNNRIIKATPSTTRQARSSHLVSHVATQQGDHMITSDTLAVRHTPRPNRDSVLDEPSTCDGAGLNSFHSTRPPDPIEATILNHKITSSVEEVGMVESDEFMDAHEQGETLASDSEMEVVNETAPFLQ